jgi:hypothetical protein
MSFLAMDPPQHPRMRGLVSRGFTPRRVAEMEDSIRALTVEHLDVCLQQGDFDFVADLAGKLPMDVISELLGVPEPDRAELRRLADLVVHREEGVLDVPMTAIESSLNLVVYYSDMLAERRKKRTDDLTSALLDAEIDGDRLDDEEIIGFMFLMVVAGNETTTKLLGNSVYWGAKNPQEIAKIYANPDRVPEWTEESLRYDTSSQIVARTSTVDIDYDAGTIPAGEKVLLLIGSANRDDAVFGDGDVYNIGRESRSTLASFGAGPHFCLGAHLARLETNIALRELIDRTKSFGIDESGAERVHSTSVRGFAALPMQVEAR